jgi:mannosyltransferase OCH1-like enzyme
MESISSLHPGWTIKLWDEPQMLQVIKSNHDLVPSHNLLNLYYQLNYLHQKVDFFRYLILYLQGGAYIDMDVEAKKSLEPLLNEFNQYQTIVGHVNLSPFESYIASQHPKTINNGTIVAKQGAQEMYAMLESIASDYSCSSPLRFTKFLCINFTTGPPRFTKVLDPFIKKGSTKVLSYDYFEPCVMKICNPTENTYLYHKQDNTWVPLWVGKITDLYLRNKMMVYLVVLISIGLVLYLLFQ